MSKHIKKVDDLEVSQMIQTIAELEVDRLSFEDMRDEAVYSIMREYRVMMVEGKMSLAELTEVYDEYMTEEYRVMDRIIQQSE